MRNMLWAVWFFHYCHGFTVWFLLMSFHSMSNSFSWFHSVISVNVLAFNVKFIVMVSQCEFCQCPCIQCQSSLSWFHRAVWFLQSPFIHCHGFTGQCDSFKVLSFIVMVSQGSVILSMSLRSLSWFDRPLWCFQCPFIHCHGFRAAWIFQCPFVVGFSRDIPPEEWH